MCNILELSGLFVCLGVPIKFVSAWGTENIVGLWYFTRVHTQADTMSQQLVKFTHISTPEPCHNS